MVKTNARKYTKKTATGKRVYKKKTHQASAVIQSAVRRAIAQNNNKMLESKSSIYSFTDGAEIFHNNFVNINSAILSTSQGITDPEQSNTLNRIGDKITLKGLSIKIMLELNERYSDVTFRLMLVRSARGDTPTRATMFKNQSGNKMLDTFNNERYTILFQKYTKLTARASATAGGAYGALGSGTYHQQDTTQVLSRATKILKMWIPGTKFSKNGVIQYENGGTQQKFYDYNFFVYAYSNYSTEQDIYYVGRVNDSIFQLYYKDA